MPSLISKFIDQKKYDQKKYPFGKYVVRSDIPEKKQIESFIMKGSFLNLDESNRIPTRNRQHRVYSFYLPAIGREVIMKVHWTDPSYPWLRRLEVRISRLIKDRCKLSFYGALALQRAGVRTFKPLAYWSYGKTCLFSEQYLLYEKVCADFSVLDYRNHICKKMTLAHRQSLDCLIEGLAEVATRIHQNNLRHGDLAFGNILVDMHGQERELEKIQLTESPDLYCIDTDRVRECRQWSAFFKRVLDIKSLKPIQLDAHEQKVFFRKYFAKTDVDFWIKMFVFWQRGRYRLIRRFRYWCYRNKEW